MSLNKSKINRREFIKKGAALAGAAACLGTLETILKGCGVLEPYIEKGPVIYKSLCGKKIDAPEHGCYIGFEPIDFWALYQQQMKVTPKIGIPIIWALHGHPVFPEKYAKELYEEGTTPFFYRTIESAVLAHSFSGVTKDKDFNDNLKKYAKNVVDFGKPLFFSTMREMNGAWNVWGQNPKVSTKVWKHMWQIMEDEGANELLTWVWEVYCPTGTVSVRDPIAYYPGDKYVDWIGLSAYSRGGDRGTDASFAYLVTPTYKQMRKIEKPIMMAEFGRTKYGQHNWIKKAYETIKGWPGMKAAIYWTADDPFDKHNIRLTRQSWNTMRKIFEDDYFIAAKKW